jgi:(p)ppGpp synthase/HD superfamily hydrolase
MYDPERRIEVEWERDGETRYQVTISVNVEDRQGILADITSVIAESHTDIRNVEAKTFDGGKGAIDVTLSVNDLKHLERVTRSLRSVEGVLDVARLSTR